jgi:hypothetical protein
MNYVIDNLDPSVPVIFYLEISDAPEDEYMVLNTFQGELKKVLHVSFSSVIILKLHLVYM